MIFLTGDTLSPGTREFLENTGAPCLSKPFALSDVREIVQRALQTQAGRGGGIVLALTPTLMAAQEAVEACGAQA